MPTAPAAGRPRRLARLPAHVRGEERSASSRLARACRGGCLTSEAGGGRNPSFAAATYICIIQLPFTSFGLRAGDASRAPLRGVVLQVVSAGAAGPAGAQAERAGARGKNATFFSFSSFFFFKKEDCTFLPRVKYLSGCQPCCDFLLFPVYTYFQLEKSARRERETFPNFLWAFEVGETAGRGSTDFTAYQGRSGAFPWGGGVQAARGRPGS